MHNSNLLTCKTIDNRGGFCAVSITVYRRGPPSRTTIREMLMLHDDTRKFKYCESIGCQYVSKRSDHFYLPNHQEVIRFCLNETLMTKRLLTFQKFDQNSSEIRSKFSRNSADRIQFLRQVESLSVYWGGVLCYAYIIKIWRFFLSFRQ